jgi:hypothetical protein
MHFSRVFRTARTADARTHEAQTAGRRSAFVSFDAPTVGECDANSEGCERCCVQPRAPHFIWHPPAFKKRARHEDSTEETSWATG